LEGFREREREVDFLKKMEGSPSFAAVFNNAQKGA
jgi:hypothetical protein